MTCNYCKLPSSLEAGAYVFVWPPQGHTLYKIANHLDQAGITFENRILDNCITVQADHPAQFVITLSGLLTANEASDTNVLIAETAEPGLGDFADVRTLKAMLGRVQSDWLIDLLEQKRFVSYAQPIVGVGDDRPVLGFEYLFRGYDEHGKMVPPDALFDSAKDPRVFFNLDRTARISAVETAARNRPDADVFINFMPGSVYDPSVCLRTTVQATVEHNIDPRRVVFEIVESQRIDDLAHLRGIVNFYRTAGFRIALDDFGTGHNNIETSIALAPDFIKLDKSLTQNMTDGDERADMVRAVTQAFHSAGIEVIAEGIESEENALAVMACGVDRMQGYYFGKPAPVDDSDGNVTQP